MGTMISKDLYDIRDVKTSDHNFILATMLRGLYYGNSYFKLIPKRIFMDNYKKTLAMLIADNLVKVASLKEDEDVIVGYSILSPDYQTIHYVYVKDDFRRMGIGRTLTPRHPSFVSHITELGYSLLNKIEGAIFNPFA